MGKRNLTLISGILSILIGLGILAIAILECLVMFVFGTAINDITSIIKIIGGIIAVFGAIASIIFIIYGSLFIKLSRRNDEEYGKRKSLIVFSIILDIVAIIALIIMSIMYKDILIFALIIAVVIVVMTTLKLVDLIKYNKLVKKA